MFAFGLLCQMTCSSTTRQLILRCWRFIPPTTSYSGFILDQTKRAPKQYGFVTDYQLLEELWERLSKLVHCWRGFFFRVGTYVPRPTCSGKSTENHIGWNCSWITIAVTIGKVLARCWLSPLLMWTFKSLCSWSTVCCSRLPSYVAHPLNLTTFIPIWITTFG